MKSKSVIDSASGRREDGSSSSLVGRSSPIAASVYDLAVKSDRTGGCGTASFDGPQATKRRCTDVLFLVRYNCCGYRARGCVHKHFSLPSFPMVAPRRDRDEDRVALGLRGLGPALMTRFFVSPCLIRTSIR